MLAYTAYVYVYAGLSSRLPARGRRSATTLHAWNLIQYRDRIPLSIIHKSHFL